MHLLSPSPEWFPYFGNQRRFVPFVKELLVGLGAQPGDMFFETNAGSHAISYHLALELGVQPVANDLGYYSCNIGKALTRDIDAAKVAARGAALMAAQGYNPTQPELFEEAAYEYWLSFIDALPKLDPQDYEVKRSDLFATLKGQSYAGKFIYADFAWPWRDGTATQEYETSSDTFGALLGDKQTTTFKVASARRILDDVIEYLDTARQSFEFVILSNQSSNYPPPEVLEAHMTACGHVPIISRRQTVPAEHVDDLGKSPTFTEYQYVFEGK